MALEFSVTLPSEVPAVREFLLKTFGADPELNSFRPEVLQWKYFSPWSAWNGPRSYLLKDSSNIVAHASAWPIRFSGDGREIKGIHLLDWAAAKTNPGAGLYILRKIAEMGDVLIGIGGSTDTREILPKFGYKKGGHFKRYVYVARPWKQIVTGKTYNWKTPLRFVRNAASRLRRIPAAPLGWTAEKVSRFDSSLDASLERCATATHLRSFKTAADLNYMLECPAAEFSGFVVSERNQQRGYFVISKVGRQARIVDIQVHADHAAEWGPISRLAARTACDDPQVCEVIVGTSREQTGEAFERIGFWTRRVEPIFYYDPHKRMEPGVIFELSFLDNDFSFFYNPQNPYIS
jgi:hypothetical protein